MADNKEIFETMPVPKATFKLVLPTVLSQLVTLIYNLADTFFVGHTNDPAQIAALTLSFPIFMTTVMVGNLFGIGANSYISRSLGRKERKNAETASTFALYGAIAFMLVIMAALGIFMKPTLNAIGAVTKETYSATRTYLTWTILYGGAPTVGALTLAHLIRSEGNTKQASIGIATGGVINIFLDYLFVSVFGMGIEGAAIATFVSNIISFIYLIVVVLRTNNSVIILNPIRLRLKGRMIKSVILVGLPAASVIVLGSVANSMLNHFMSSYGDTSAVAGFGLVHKIGSIAIQITIGLTQGIMPLLGYCYGSGNIKRFRDVSNLSFKILACYAVICVSAVVGFSEPFIRLFTSEADTVVKGTQYLRIWFFCAPGMCFTNLFGSIFQSMGKWFHSLILSVTRQLLLLLPLIFILNGFFGQIGLVYAQPISDTMTLVVGIVLYIIIMKQYKTEPSN